MIKLPQALTYHIYKYASMIIRFYFSYKFKILMDPLLRDPFTETLHFIEEILVGIY